MAWYGEKRELNLDPTFSGNAYSFSILPSAVNCLNLYQFVNHNKLTNYSVLFFYASAGYK